MALKDYISYQDDKKEKHSSVEARIDFDERFCEMSCYGYGVNDIEAHEELMENFKPIRDLFMDDRQHADLANNIRDAIIKLWPDKGINRQRLRTVITHEIGEYRDGQTALPPIDSFSGEYRFLSNFYPSPIKWHDGIYPTVEHIFQAFKTIDPEERDEIRNAKTPGEAKRLGRKVTLRPDWNDIKIEVMNNFLQSKFRIPELRNKLMDTGTRELIEGNTWGDRFWGVDGTGKNELGKLLMEIRGRGPQSIVTPGMIVIDGVL